MKTATPHKQHYSCPLVDINSVELEQNCMIVTSSATSSGQPQVTDYTDQSLSEDIWLN